MDLNSFTWLLVTYVLFQMYTTPTLIQSAYNSSNVTTCASQPNTLAYF
jgi:hypothetical protein